METKTKNKVDQMVQEATAGRAAVGMEILPQDYLRIARTIRAMNNKGETNHDEKTMRELLHPLYEMKTARTDELWGQIWEAEKDNAFPSNLNKTQLFIFVQDRKFRTTDKYLRARSNQRQDELNEEINLLNALMKTLENSVPTTA